MNTKTPVSALKTRAREQLLSNYSVAIGSAVLMMVMTYSVISLMSGAISAFAFGRSAGSQGVTAQQMEVLMSNPHNEMMMSILTYIVMFIVYPLITMFSVGFLYICRDISYGRRTAAFNLFFAFKNHPDKIIIMSVITYVIQLVLMLPSIIYGYVGNKSTAGGREFLINMILSVAGSAAFIVVSMAISQCYLIYLDDIEKGAVQCLKESLEMMKGNKWRFFYMQLSFIGYYALAVLSLGIALLWIAPYTEVATVNFYRDLKGETEENKASAETESGSIIDIGI